MRVVHICISIALFCTVVQIPLKLFSQADTSIHLSQVSVSDFKLKDFQQGVSITRVDSITQTTHTFSSAADLLAEQGGLYIKNYGPGTLSTMSVRGLGASHTPVFWNGVNLQNGMNGTFDLSLIPGCLADDMQIVAGGSSTLFGSGAMSGAVLLNHSGFPFRRGWRTGLWMGYGSFSNYHAGLQVAYSGGRVSVSVRGYYQQGLNDFPFRNTALAGAPMQRQRNSAFATLHLIPELSFQVLKNGLLKMVFWLSHTDRQIPPGMLSGQANAQQTDRNYRLNLTYSHEFRRAVLWWKSALISDELGFNDSLTNVKSRSQVWHLFQEIEYRQMQGKRHSWRMALTHDYFRARSGSLTEGGAHQTRLSGMIAYTYRSLNNKVLITPALRVESLVGHQTPVLPMICMVFVPHGNVVISVNASRNFRFPTLNDLYWNPGGNPDLKTEQAWSSDIGLKFHRKALHQNFNYSIETQPFFMVLQNRIIWLPDASFWRPVNIPQSRSAGIEWKGEISQRIKKCTLQVKGNYTYTASTNESSTSENDDSKGKQLIYVPQHQAGLRVSAEWKGFYFGISNQYTGSVFVTTDNSSSLKPFLMSNFHFSKRISLSRLAITYHLNINNLFNQNYQVMQWRAMPGIHFNTGFSITFQHKINSNAKK